MAAVQSPPPAHPLAGAEMMDTRTPSPVHANGDVATPDSDEYKPDLTAEVSMLSTKLVNAINYQTNLDDSLQQTRHELEQAKKELSQIRLQKKLTDDQVANGILVRKSALDNTMSKLRSELEAEKAARETAEKAKKQTEGELENLTTALFEEANTMVAAARKDTEAVEKRNSQLRTQLEDTELLLASQTEQLRDLKDNMERLERLSEQGARDASVPATPVDARTAVWDALQLSPGGHGHDVVPDHPLHFSQLLAPVLRTDTAAYTDFRELLLLAQRAAPPHSRQASGSAHNIASTSTPNLHSTNASTSATTIPGSFFSSSANNSPSSSTFGNQAVLPPLKDSKFYKRTLNEDIEPTLRLDLAPGLSFLSRRSVLSSLLSGSLVVEPFNAAIKSYGLGSVFACSLCGEQRKNEPYIRKHRFRTSESEDAQRYPLCDWCLGRIRASGDFVGFLRMLRDGHWRTECEEDEKDAWEEATRLRERMFWARLGGGVVPASQLNGMRREMLDSPESVRAIESARQSLEGIPERMTKPADTTEAAEQNRRTSTIARAVMGPPSGGLATSRPDATPNGHLEHDTSPATSDEQADNSPTLEEAPALQMSKEEVPEQPTTPFEDAPSDLSSSQEQSAAADQQLQNEIAAQSSSLEEKTEVPVLHSIPIVNEPTPSSEAEVSTPPRPQRSERRPSAVLARVRAMEQGKQRGSKSPERKLPGGFD
ncbi:rab guanine nucleotide exchange factor S2 [Recurvomyces mirabilis]|uniref:Rab guanine nucleotide exchange factor S2 n=1 Tax=Recurvomyces mirabilis TaxID=574656 RepID=A0AAE0WIN4_9PEZI|nr:rab guanine nucleotide exchange factor S2 [Recurvomyces mirabilis]KAK5154288.1 rab guanine nucleotide exchange factor S2 [Recurvomyces mirabilis]